MNTHKLHVACIGPLATSVLLLGCRNAPEVAAGSATATTLAPAVASYGSAYAVNNLKQDVLIVAGVNAEALGEEINYEQMVALSGGRDASGLWVVPEWMYMGTKQGYHFLAYYPPLFGMRKIYRIREAQYRITQSFDLTGVSTRWRTLPEPELPLVRYRDLKLLPWWEPLNSVTNPLPWDPVSLRYDLNPAAKPENLGDGK